uniref:Uncharacterized protein n=1 Tax=Tanacetum cinerariifolium TaxID=118510 RepID=A0A6L2KCT5_TANCI|nr:hypothetical protein [Tanacetum cinerariifolium]
MVKYLDSVTKFLMYPSVADEAVNKEMDDSLERAATTATSLDTECQEAIGDTAAQTRSKRVSKISNDPLLAGVNTPRNLEIDSLKRRVKKLKRRKKSRTHGLKRLYKVGLSARVESTEDEGLGEEDASKHRRIADIDENEDITLVSTHDEQMFDADQDLGGEEVFVAQQDEKVVEKEVDAAQIKVTTAATTTTISINEATFAQALAALKHAKPKAKAKRIVFHVPEESTTTATKRAEEKRNKPPTKAQQRKIMCTYLKNIEGNKLTYLKNKSFDSIQKMFDGAFKRVNTFVDYITELIEESSKKTEEKLKEGSSKRAGTELKQEVLRSRSHMLKDFDREDAETQWKLVKSKYGSTRLEGDYERVLWGDLKVMFEPHIEDKVWKMQQRYKVVRWMLFNSCGVYCLILQSGHIFIHNTNLCHLDTTHHPATADIVVDIVVAEVGTADNTGHTMVEHTQLGCRLPAVEHYTPQLCA